MPKIAPWQVRIFKVPNSIRNPKRRFLVGNAIHEAILLVGKAIDEAILIINSSLKSAAISKRYLFKVQHKTFIGLCYVNVCR